MPSSIEDEGGYVLGLIFLAHNKMSEQADLLVCFVFLTNEMKR